MSLIKKGFLVFVLLFITNCSHLKEKINNLPYHTSKSTILDDLGRPFKIKRVRGLDHWIYKFKIKKKEYTQVLIFKEGHFIKSKPIKPYPSYEKLLEEAENFKEYKEAVKRIKKNRKNIK